EKEDVVAALTMVSREHVARDARVRVPEVRGGVDVEDRSGGVEPWHACHAGYSVGSSVCLRGTGGWRIGNEGKTLRGGWNRWRASARRPRGGVVERQRARTVAKVHEPRAMREFRAGPPPGGGSRAGSGRSRRRPPRARRRARPQAGRRRATVRSRAAEGRAAA